MLAKRIIPCLDIKDGKVVKGINFLGIKEVGDPVECAVAYDRQGADEIVFLDIMASCEGRGTVIEVVRKTAEKVFVPLTVGGGIRSAEDFYELLRAGADKIAVNSAAVRNPQLLSDAAKRFGSQCVVLSVDAKRKNGHFIVTVNGGRVETELDAVEWAVRAEQLGAGEIVLNSIDADGTKNGFDIEMTAAVSGAVGIPVIASGGCGKAEDFVDIFARGKADAALAASVFHYGELTVGQVKQLLAENNIPVRRV